MHGHHPFDKRDALAIALPPGFSLSGSATVVFLGGVSGLAGALFMPLVFVYGVAPQVIWCRWYSHNQGKALEGPLSAR